MKWVKNQLGIIVTLAVLLGGGLVAWGRMSQLCTQIDAKADREPIMRELDHIQAALDRIESRLDDMRRQ